MLALLGLTLAGCGFQLRGYELDANVQSFAITGMTRAQVVAPLKRALQQAGAEEVAQSEANVVVALLDQRSERRSVSTAGQARVAEYEVDYAVQYQLLGADGTELTPSTWIERQRIYRLDRGNIVGSSEEQALLQREMLQDVVGQIVRAMDLVSRQAVSADPVPDAT